MTGAIGVLLLSAFAATANGQLHLEVDRCPAAPADEVARLVQIELDVELVETAGLGVPWASIRCEGTRAHLTYDRAERTIDLKTIDPRARPRLLALALAELASSSRPRPRPPPAPYEREVTPSIPPRSEPPPPVKTSTATPPPPPPAPLTRTATPSAALHVAASALGGVTLFSGAGPPGFGGRAALELAPATLGGRIDVGAAFGSGKTELGTVSVLLAGVGISGFGRFTGGLVVFDVGAGLRVGFARITGTPRDPSAHDGGTVSGPWTGPFLDARSTFHFGPLQLVAELEGGLVIRPVIGRSDGVPVAAVDGAWFGFHLGLGLEP